jgi:hypothetical protein
MKLSISICVLTLLCVNSYSQSDDSFKKEAMKVINDVKEREVEHEKEVIGNNAFSKGVREVVEWFNHKTQLMARYTPTEIKSASGFNSLLTSKKYDTLQALYLNFSSTSEDVKNIDLAKLVLFKNLEFLKITNTKRTPGEVFSLMKLKVLICSFADLDSIWKLPKLKNLEHLELKFSDDVLPVEIGEMTKLVTLRLYNFSTNQPYMSIYKLPALETLWIRYANDHQVEGISGLKKLKTLVTNRVTEEISQLENLTGLIINENSNLDYSRLLSNLDNLVALKLQGNYEMTEAPKFVADLKKIEYIEIRGCDKLVSIPDCYNALSSLKRFDVFYNKAFKTMPSNLDKIRSVIQVQ